MAKYFSLAEKIAMYKDKNNPRGNFSLPQKIDGHSMLEKMEKLYYLTRNRPIKSAAVDPRNTNMCITVCLIIVDELHHEDIWRSWISQGDESDCPFRARLVIHAKNPEKIISSWVRRHTLQHSFRPEWNSVEVIRAMMACLEEAMKDEKCGHIVFGTESCIPVRSLRDVGAILLGEDRSWLDCYHRSKNAFEETSCFRTVDPNIVPSQCVWKALPGWISLCRRHALEIARLPALLGGDPVVAWNRVYAPEEMFFPTMLCVLGFLRDGGDGESDEVRRKRVTFARWVRRGDARPETFSRIDEESIHLMRSSGALFGRKFAAYTSVSSLSDWTRAMRRCGESDKPEGVADVADEVRSGVSREGSEDCRKGDASTAPTKDEEDCGGDRKRMREE